MPACRLSAVASLGLYLCDAGGAAAPLEVYEEYGPLVLAQHRRLETRQLPTFDDALSEFYSKVGPAWQDPPPPPRAMRRGDTL